MNIETLDTKLATLSDKYKLVKTRDIITKIESLGFTLEKFIANKTKKVERQGFQKHRAIFNSPTFKNNHNEVGHLQLLVTNSHDGSSSLQFQLGFFRVVCSNGLVIGSTVESIRLQHKGTMLYDNVERAVERMVAQADIVNADIERMRLLTVSDENKAILFNEAANLRMPDKKIVKVDFGVRRFEDNKNDLFTVFNVAQENIIRAGAFVTTEENGVLKTQKLRAINSIDTQTRLNQQLYDFAVKLAA